MGKKIRQSARDSSQTLVERDLSALAAARKLPEGYGLDQSAAELATLLTRGGKAPLLAGESGVGKSAVVQELARRISQGNVPPGLADARVLEMTAAGIFARTSTPKAAAELLEEFIDEAAERPNTILFMRDVGQVRGSSLVPVLIRALRTARVRFIFESDTRAAQELLRSDETLAEKLHLFVVNEPALDRARWILGRVAEEMEVEQGIPIDPSACDLALRLSVKFLLAQRLPRKAIELLRETVTESAGASRERVTSEDVLARFCNSTRLPRFMADDSMALDLDEVSRFFGSRLLGQNDAVAAVLRSVRCSRPASTTRGGRWASSCSRALPVSARRTSRSCSRNTSSVRQTASCGSTWPTTRTLVTSRCCSATRGRRASRASAAKSRGCSMGVSSPCCCSTSSRRRTRSATTASCSSSTRARSSTLRARRCPATTRSSCAPRTWALTSTGPSPSASRRGALTTS